MADNTSTVELVRFHADGIETITDAVREMASVVDAAQGRAKLLGEALASPAFAKAAERTRDANRRSELFAHALAAQARAADLASGAALRHAQRVGAFSRAGELAAAQMRNQVAAHDRASGAAARHALALGQASRASELMARQTALEVKHAEAASAAYRREAAALREVGRAEQLAAGGASLAARRADLRDPAALGQGDAVRSQERQGQALALRDELVARGRDRATAAARAEQREILRLTVARDRDIERQRASEELYRRQAGVRRAARELESPAAQRRFDRDRDTGRAEQLAAMRQRNLAAARDLASGATARQAKEVAKLTAEYEKNARLAAYAVGSQGRFGRAGAFAQMHGRDAMKLGAFAAMPAVAAAGIVGGAARSGFGGTVEMERFQVAQERFSRAMAGAFVPVLNSATYAVSRFADIAQRLDGRQQRLVAGGVLLVAGLGAAAAATLTFASAVGTFLSIARGGAGLLRLGAGLAGGGAGASTAGAAARVAAVAAPGVAAGAGAAASGATGAGWLGRLGRFGGSALRLGGRALGVGGMAVDAGLSAYGVASEMKPGDAASGVRAGNRLHAEYNRIQATQNFNPTGYAVDFGMGVGRRVGGWARRQLGYDSPAAAAPTPSPAAKPPAAPKPAERRTDVTQLPVAGYGQAGALADRLGEEAVRMGIDKAADDQVPTWIKRPLDELMKWLTRQNNEPNTPPAQTS